jgi:hypothetical protein
VLSSILDDVLCVQILHNLMRQIMKIFILRCWKGKNTYHLWKKKIMSYKNFHDEYCVVHIYLHLAHEIQPVFEELQVLSRLGFLFGSTYFPQTTFPKNDISPKMVK